ncbi:MAG: DUF2063 domain-containing protein [Mehylophilales bacterium 35-46-6]|nr:MAG: DUF2063 domain-containing protein [Mehylophilales bacterium 35-46-6]
MSAQLPSFQHYQLEFTARLRDPASHPAPAGVSAERMAVYDEIVFNNLFESVSACYPVASAVLGKRRWLKLNQAFMREYSAGSPLFRKIPEQFLHFLQHSDSFKNDLPPYIHQLCHYEWIELHVGAMPVNDDRPQLKETLDLKSGIEVFNPTMQLLDYDYAVHKISPRKKPKQTQNTQLLVYRNAQHEVKFVEINAVTYNLITLMQAQGVAGGHALQLLAQQLGHPQPEVIIQFGMMILEDLWAQDIIIGVTT